MKTIEELFADFMRSTHGARDDQLKEGWVQYVRRDFMSGAAAMASLYAHNTVLTLAPPLPKSDVAPVIPFVDGPA